MVPKFLQHLDFLRVGVKASQKKSSADLKFVQFVWSLKLMQFLRKTNEKRSRSIKQKTRINKNLSRIDIHMWF